MNESIGAIFLNACLINNFVLAYFLGICPFLGVSGKLATATRMGGAVMFVMLVSSVCAYGIHAALVAIDAPYLRLISFIAVIASTVQFVELAIKKAAQRSEGSVLASDAFFPFPDSIELAAKAGVRAIVQPGGSRNDADVIAACNRLEVPMVLTGRRHFKH